MVVLIFLKIFIVFDCVLWYKLYFESLFWYVVSSVGLEGFVVNLFSVFVICVCRLLMFVLNFVEMLFR